MCKTLFFLTVSSITDSPSLFQHFSEISKLKHVNIIQDCNHTGANEPGKVIGKRKTDPGVIWLTSRGLLKGFIDVKKEGAQRVGVTEDAGIG